MSKPYVVVKYHRDWADEFDLKTIWVGPKDRWAAIKEKLKTGIKYPVSFSFGTNEEQEINDAEDVLGYCEVKGATLAEAAALRKFLKPTYQKAGNTAEFGTLEIFRRIGELNQAEDE